MRIHSQSSIRQENGNALVMTVLFLLVLFGFAALSIDMGNVYVNRQQIQEGSDASAFGAVQTWATPPPDATATVNVGTLIATTNNIQNSEIVSITPGTWNASSKNFQANQSNFGNNAVPAVRVIAQRQVPMYFGKLFGFSTMTVRVQAIAIAAQATGAFNMMPWYTCQNNPQPPQLCDSITIKFDGTSFGGTNDCSGSGNYGALTMPGGSGGDWYRQNIESSYPGVIRIGDVIQTETGNKVGPTQQGLSDRLAGAPPYTCPATPIPSQRLAIVVLTDKQGWSKDQIVVTGFWVFAMDDPQGGQVTGHFLQIFAGTEIDPSKPPVVTGVNGVALVN